MKKKLPIILVAVLVVVGGVYKFVLSTPPVIKKKVDGEVYVLPKDFLINLSDGRFVKLDVALVIEEGSALPAGGGEEAATPPEGYGTMPQEAVVRDIITNTVSDVPGRRLISREGRESLKKKI